MPGVVLDRFNLEQEEAEPWSDSALLIKPLLDEQALMYQVAQCLAVELYLKMCKLEYRTEEAPNAADMAPSGAVPLLVCGNFMLSGFDRIVEFISKKNIVPQKLEETDHVDMECYTSMVHSVFVSAEMFSCWLDPDTYSQYTAPRFTSVHPWPLAPLLLWLQRRRAHRRLDSLKWRGKSAENVYEEVSKCCESLSTRLYNSTAAVDSQAGSGGVAGGSGYFFGAAPCALDALVTGHVLAITGCDASLRRVLDKYTALVRLAHRLATEYSLDFCY